MLDKIGSSSQSAARSLNVKSALNPLLWLTGISTPLCFIGAYVFIKNTNISEMLIQMGFLPIIVTCLGFAYFAVFKPEKITIRRISNKT